MQATASRRRNRDPPPGGYCGQVVRAGGAGLVYAGYIGGSDDDHGLGIAVDSTGSAYVTGRTASTEATFPAAVGPDLTFNGGHYDAFVAKVQADGSGLGYAGYIGGSNYDHGYGIAVDGAGSAYVTGSTSSTEATFPEFLGPDLTFNGYYDAFVAKVQTNGATLTYAGYLGGSGGDCAYGIAVDEAGSAYLAGYTESSQSTFPVSVGPDLSQNGDWDAFVAKVAVDGRGLRFAGYLGGSGYDYGFGVAVDGAGNTYVTGYTASPVALGFPVTVGPDLTHGGSSDAFVVKMRPFLEVYLPVVRRGW